MQAHVTPRGANNKQYIFFSFPVSSPKTDIQKQPLENNELEMKEE